MITCTFEDGGKASLRHVTVNALVLDNKNRILLVKRAPRLSNGGKYGLIGGFVNRDETVVEAIHREVKEEVGYEISIEKQLRLKDWPNREGEDRQNIEFVFVARGIKQVGKPDNESTEVTWFDLDKLPDKNTFAFDHFEDIEMYKKDREK